MPGLPLEQTVEGMLSEMEAFGYDRPRVRDWMKHGGRIWKDEEGSGAYVIGVNPLVSYYGQSGAGLLEGGRRCGR